MATKSPRDDERRTVSAALRNARSREEQETLLGDEEEADHEGCVGLTQQVYFTPNPHSKLPVYRTLHRIRRLILATIEDPYTLEQLRSLHMNRTVVRPLIHRLYDQDDVSVVYCCLVNRMHFLHERAARAHHLSINGTRANLCEMLATRLLRRYDDDHPGRKGLLILANILVAGFAPFQNAPDQVLRDNDMQGWSQQYSSGIVNDRSLTVLEVAIISESKVFLSSQPVQKVVQSIYIGRIVYTPHAFIDIIPDQYKHRPISLYDPRRASRLNQYRLIVPRTRNYIELAQFVVLLALFMLTLANRDDNAFTNVELCFMVYGTGWCLDEIAAILEHGWHVHTQNMWAFFDVTFLCIFTPYLAMRLHAHVGAEPELGRQALDVLSLAAPVLLPRLAFNLMPENMLFLALRAMMGDFLFLTALAVWCSAGFLLAMNWLSRWGSSGGGAADDDPDVLTLSKWMLWIWFGLDGTGVQRSVDFHLILGPVLMIAFAFLGNTLFLTILVSMLSTTFAKVAADSAAEIQFRRAVLTFEGVKSDAIFAYRPPFNVVALFVLLPLKFALSPRWFHKVNVTAVRVLNFPTLLAVTAYERRNLWNVPTGAIARGGDGKRGAAAWWQFWLWGRGFLNAHGDIQAVFDAEPPQEMVDEIEEEDMLDEDLWSVGAPGWAAPGWAGLTRWSSVVGLGRRGSVSAGGGDEDGEGAQGRAHGRDRSRSVYQKRKRESGGD